MNQQARHTNFDSMHPVVPTIYFVGTIGLVMFALQPVLVALGLLGGLACSVAYRGWRATVRGLRWQLPLAALICLANPLFSASGSTVLWRWGGFAVYAESLAYGAMMGCLMISTVLWFECASVALTQDKVLAVGGRVLPTVSLMVSMAAQLVPQLVRRGHTVSDAMRACTAATALAGKKDGADGGAAPGETDGRPGARLRRRVAPHARLWDVLMGWALEDSIERADAMRARGWGVLEARRRTSYVAYRLRRSDVAWAVGLAASIVACAVLAGIACSQWRFYPTMPRLVTWWGYVPFAALVALPSVAQGLQYLQWRNV